MYSSCCPFGTVVETTSTDTENYLIPQAECQKPSVNQRSVGSLCVYVMTCMCVCMYETPYAGACAPTLREMTDWLVAARMRARVIVCVFH
jgi:hypothetical protein